MQQDLVSIIIPTYKRDRVLREAIEYVLHQDYPNLEVLIVDQSEEHDQETDAYLSSRSGEIRYYHLREPNLPAARNFGVLKSRGDIVVFFDDDLSIPPDTLSRVMQIFATSEVWGATGRIEFTGSATPHRSFGDAGATRPVRVSNFLGGFMCFRRSLFRKIGFFDEWIGRQPLASGEDFEFTLRATMRGYSLYYDPRIVVVHPALQSGGCGRAALQQEQLLMLQMRLSSYAYIKNRRGHGIIAWANALWRCHRSWIVNRDGLRRPLKVYGRYPKFLRMLKQAIVDARDVEMTSSDGVPY